MLQLIKSLLKDKSKYLAPIITISIAVLSLIRIGKQPINFTYLDKIEHAIAYAVLTFLWLIAFGKTKKDILIIITSCIFYGIIIEVLQKELTTYRNFDYADMVANSIGVFTALLIFKKFVKKENVFGS